MRRAAIVLVFLGLLLGAVGVTAAQSACGFTLGFATLQSMIPNQVGQCLENENHNNARGDGLQHTTGGLMVWRKADNHTAFTDGYRTWLNGPCGLQQRLNTQRFTWEPEFGQKVNCQAAAQAFIPGIPHPVAGREQCLSCHQTGVGGATVIPTDHAGRTTDTCQVCHKAIPGAGAAPQVPHQVQGVADCTSCHTTGALGAKVMPTTHAGFSTDVCLNCHVQGQQTVGLIGPGIPHQAEGISECRYCHTTGALGAKNMPPNHGVFGNDSCQYCHPPTVQGTNIIASAIPHTLQGITNCTACHATGAAGAKVVPANHAGLGNDTCQNCHKQGPITVQFGASLIPHTLQGITDCLSCHTTGALGAKVVPASHAGRGNGTCQTCHQQGPITVQLRAASGVPHTTAGSDCRACHTGGIAGATNIPSDHGGRGNDTCLTCHPQTGGGPVMGAPRIDHGVGGRENCTACHRVGGEGDGDDDAREGDGEGDDAEGMPGNHAGWPNGICLACHQA